MSDYFLFLSASLPYSEDVLDDFVYYAIIKTCILT